MESIQNLNLEATKSAPAVAFNIDGHLKLEGKFIPDNAITVFEPLFAWIQHLEAEKVVFDINLEYLNTSSSMQLFSLLRKLEENCLIKSIVINWYFEKDDEDHYDTGLFFEEKLYRAKFNYLSVA
ncbi:MAG: DUF1987 domain-containing protein [Bacteroidales bacterium]|nr:DUF1987 domain-containing protein [Bacteroidales bacterium]